MQFIFKRHDSDNTNDTYVLPRKITWKKISSAIKSDDMFRLSKRYASLVDLSGTSNKEEKS